MNNPATPSDSKIKVGSVWPSNNFGDFKVLEYISSVKVLIEFIATGYVTVARSSNIKNGEVKDKLLPSVFGVGFVGLGRNKPSVNGEHTKSYAAWKGILRRCYCPKARAKYPTYSDCTVSKEWHNFQNFADWFELKYTEGFDLDKDKLSKGSKIYSEEACVFISHAENIVLAHSKEFAFLSPSGALHAGNNLAEFARLHGLNPSCLTSVKVGRRKHHKGWTVA